MSHPLDGARFKVVRAKKHIDTLKAELRAYLEKHTEEIVRDCDQKEVEHTARLNSPIPVELSLIAGDVVTNARAALDYIAWELANKYLDPPIDLSKRDDRIISSFPLFDKSAGFVSWKNRLTQRAGLFTVRAPAIDCIERVQPYNAGYEPLWLLHELVNTDKHRMLLLTTINPGGVTGAIDLTQFDFSGPIVLAQFTVSATADSSTVRKPKMDMGTKPTVEVAFEDSRMPRKPMDVTLENIVTCIDGVIPLFDEFFL